MGACAVGRDVITDLKIGEGHADLVQPVVVLGSEPATSPRMDADFGRQTLV